jgi:hypothetical protein
MSWGNDFGFFKTIAATVLERPMERRSPSSSMVMILFLGIGSHDIAEGGACGLILLVGWLGGVAYFAKAAAGLPHSKKQRGPRAGRDAGATRRI